MSYIDYVKIQLKTVRTRLRNLADDLKKRNLTSLLPDLDKAAEYVEVAIKKIKEVKYDE